MFKTLFALIGLGFVLAVAGVYVYNFILTERIVVEMFGRTLYQCVVQADGVPYIAELIIGNLPRCPLF